MIQAKAGIDEVLAAKGILGGIPLESVGMGKPGEYLVAITEMTTKADIDRYAGALGE